MLYLVFFSVGMGGTPWTINSEIYPLHLRGCGLSISTTTNWVTNYFVSQLFLTLMKTPLSRVLTFSSISIFALLAWIFVYLLIPETKGRTIEDIVSELCPESVKNPLEIEHIMKIEEEE